MRKLIPLLTALSLTGCASNLNVERTIELAREGIPFREYKVKVRPKLYNTGELFRDPMKGMDNIGLKSTVTLPIDKQNLNGKLKLESHSDLQTDNWGININFDVKY